MSDTPRTDQHEYYFINHDDSAGESLERICDGRDVSWDDEYMGAAVPASLARTIERENAMLRAALETIQSNDPEANRQHADEIANAALGKTKEGIRLK